MSDRPPRATDVEGFTACPHCTIQIPSDAEVCPHCQQIVVPSEDARPPGYRRGGVTGISVLRERYGRWLLAAGPVLLALVVLALVYRQWAGYGVKVSPGPSLPVRWEQERRGEKVVLRGAVTNEGEDVPDLSLRSVGIIVEFVYRDGRVEKRTVFPKAEFRGEGALLRGETGRFEIEGEAKGLREVLLRSEIVDLGMGRRLIPPRGR